MEFEIIFNVYHVFDKITHSVLVVFYLFIGIADEGFEMLEHLAYLYLANNKVSHTPDFKMFVLKADQRSAGILSILCHLTIILLYFDSLTWCQLAETGGNLLSCTLCELMLVITSSMAVPAGQS